MVYARKRKRSRRKGRSRKRSRLADKRINTLFEKRALEIAKKEVKKSHEWYTTKQITKDPNFNWDTHGPYVRVPSASCFSLNPGSLYHLRLSDIGNILENDLLPIGGTETLMNNMRVSSFRSSFDFRYNGASDCLIDISIVKVNGSQLLATQTTMPNILMVEPLNNFYKFWPAQLRQRLDYKFQRIAHKRIKMRPAKIYTDSHTTSNAGSNQGYAFANTSTVHTDPSRKVTLTKSFKGAGAKLYVENAARPPQTEYYLLVVADRPIEFCAVHATRFRLEKAADLVMPIIPPPS